MKLTKILSIILLLSLSVPGPVLDLLGAAQAGSSRQAADQKTISGAVVSVVAPVVNQTVAVVQRPAAPGPGFCALAAQSSLLQGSVGINLFSGGADCSELKVAASQTANRIFAIKNQPAYTAQVVIKTIPSSIQNQSGLSSLPQPRAFAPVPLALVLALAVFYSSIKLASVGAKRPLQNNPLAPLSLPQLQVFRC